MNEGLLLKMASDMKLFRFSNELYANFAARVIYSGMAMWMKAIALDGFQDNIDELTTVSKKYHTERSEFILNQFIRFIPELKEWFFDSDSLIDSLFPIHELQGRLLQSGELMELGFTNRITSVQPTRYRLSGGITHCKGLHNGIQPQYNGIASVIEEKLSNNACTDTQIDTLDFAEKCIESANFSKDLWAAEKEYYNPLVETDTFYKSWESKKPEQDYYISRIETGIKQYRYFFETTENGTVKSSKVDDYIIESESLLRILLALRHKANNPVSITITYFTDHFEVKRYVHSFPKPEEFVFSAFGWPINSISDNLNFSYHNYMLPMIKQTLQNLLIKINEVNYE